MRIQKIQSNPYQQNKQNKTFKSNVLAEVRFKYNQDIDIMPLGIKTLTQAIRRNFIALESYIDSPTDYIPKPVVLYNEFAIFFIKDPAHTGEIEKLSGELAKDGKSIQWDSKANLSGELSKDGNFIQHGSEDQFIGLKNENTKNTK